MISCPNKKLKAWKDLVKVVGEDDALELWNHFKGMVPSSYYNNSGEFYQLAPVGKSDNLQYQFKVVDKIVNNLDKVIKWSNTKGLDIWKKLQQDLQIPKNQIELLKESEGNTIEEKLASFAANYSYIVEIKRTKQKDIGTKDIKIYKDAEYTEDESKPWVVVFEDQGEETVFNFATKEEAENVAKNHNKYNSGMPTNYYKDLTVPGGVNYVEVELVTPDITPSIEGHAQFATDKGIGWVRSDDLITELTEDYNTFSKRYIQETEKEFKYTPDTTELNRAFNAIGKAKGRFKTDSKTRRILEVQSDLFQKGRSQEVLTPSSEIPYNNKQIENIIDRYTSGESITKEEEIIASQYVNNKNITNPKNQFLQLLNKDNNWVTFFVKSIIQDSAKKGYEKVVFPRLDTIIQIESQGEFKTYKEAEKYYKDDNWKLKLKSLEEHLKEVQNYTMSSSEWLEEQDSFDTPELQEFLKNKPEEAFKYFKDNIISGIKHQIATMQPTLLSTAKFYEETITNVLEKQYGKENVKQITDEYGNSWNEVEVKPEFEDPIFFQLSNLLKDEETVYTDDEESTDEKPIEELAKPNKELNKKLKSFLEKLGFKYEEVERIITKKGLDATAMVNLFTKIVQVVEEKADMTTLPEEVAHVFVGLMDKNSLLYKRMYNTITNYQVYQKVVDDYGIEYNNDERKLREEAIGKLIATKIIQQNNNQDTSELNNSFNKWWNSIWQRIKALFTDNNQDPFVETANKILTNNTAGLKKSGENENFYQLTNTMTPDQAAILNKIDEDQKYLTKVENENERYYSYQGKRLGKSVTTRIDEKLDKNFAEKTPEEKAKYKPSSDYGTAAHADLENAGRIILAGENVVKVVSTNDNTYSKIEKYMKEFKKQFPEGTQYRFETKVYDRRKEEPGTIDLLIVEPSGLTHVFDYKNTTFSKKEKTSYGEPATYKVKSWNLKVARYSSILRDNYNVTNFGKRRAIPTEFLYSREKISGIKLGDPGYSKKEEYLNPVPLLEENILPKSNSEEDIENAEKLNNLLNQLRKLYNDTEKLKVKDPTQRELVYAKLVKLRKAIKSLQLATNFDDFIEAGQTELEYIKTRLEDKINPVTATEIVSFYETTNAFSSLSDSLIHLLLDETIDKELQQSLNKLEKLAKSYKSKLTKEFKNIIIKEATEIGEQDPFAAQKKASNPFKNINQINHPLFRIFWNLVNKKKIQTRKDIESLEGKINKSIKALEAWAGTTGIDKFKHLINGKNLIFKYTQEFNTQKEAAYKNKNVKWFKDNYIVNEAGLKDFLEKKEKEIKSNTYSTDKKENLKKTQEALKRLHESYNVLKYDSAYLYRKNGFIKPSDKWLSEEYKFIYKKGNEPLKDFYELFTKTIRELGEHLPVDIKGNFIPEIEESLIDAVFNSGLGSISGMGSKFTESFKIKSSPGYGEVNEFTGEIERTIPIYYVNKAENKSLDLGKSLALFAQMALNYKHMSEIEGTVYTLKHALQNPNLSKEYVTNAINKISKDESGRVITTNTSLATLEAFNDFMNYYLYDIRTKDKDIPLTKTSVNENGEVETTTYSLNKIVKKTLSTYSMTSLTLNAVSGGANLVGGISNVMMQASRGRYFTNKDVLKSAALLTSNNEKAYKLIKYFNIMGEQTLSKKIDKLSSSKISGNLNEGKFYFLQHGGDWLVQNTTLLSMLQGHTVENGKIVGLKKSSNKQSLMDLAEFKDGQLIIPGITEEQFDIFRSKTQRLAENILGMSTRDNVARYRLNLVGQVFGQFRNWIPRMAEERFGSLTYDYDLETLTKGKYASFVQTVFNKSAIPLIKELIIGYGPAMDARVQELFNKELDAHPELASKLTLEEFKQMHLENLNAMKTELILIGTFAATLLMSKVGDDDDDDKTPLQKQLTKLWSRSLNELTFFADPSSFKQILKTPVPIMGLLDNILNLFGDTFKQWTGVALDNEDWQKDAKPLKYLARTFPGTNAINRWFDK